MVGMLQGHGIHAIVSGDDVGGIDLALQAQGVRVLVPGAQADEARHLLGRDQEEKAGGREPNAFQRWIVRVLGGSTSRS